ncbi:MAG TPA: phospholipid carrier-dependent glycosyltransferase [Candidatus Kryptonia bacterium]|nr:phospholipid carrier-dependent glycosyltransferase [Candidatus Kryptonia bacterium]
MATSSSKRGRAARRRQETAAVRRHHSLARPMLLLVVLVAAVYANSIPNDFVFDDHTLVDFNPEVNPASAGAIEQRQIQYRPLRIWSYVLDREIGGHRPASYRIGNMVYHALTGCVALATYRQLGLTPATALIAASLFVVHPVQTESVAYISGRRDVLCGLFTMLAFCLYLRWRGTPRRWWNFALSLVALGLGVMSKEVAAAFPLLVGIHDLTISLARQRAATPGRSIFEAALAVLREQWIAYAVLLLLSGAGAIYLLKHGVGTDQWWWGGTIITNALNVALLWVHSGMLLLLPVRLLADYSYEAVPVISTAASPLAWAAVAALVGLLILSIWLTRRMPRVVFLLWWIAITLLPSSHVIPHHDFFAEHYLYLPVFGFAGLLAIALMRIGRQFGLSRQRVEAIAVAIVLLYGVRTIVRNRDWRDDLTFARVTSQTAPRCARAHGNYGGALLTHADVDAAEPEFRAALAIQPDQTSALSGLIMVMHAKGRTEERDALLAQMIKQPLFSYPNFLSLAGWFLMNGEYELAIRTADYATTRPGVDDRLWSIQGWAYARSGRLDQACPLFEKALRRNPGSVDARNGRELCQRQRGRS